jgi:hypothetical protein
MVSPGKSLDREKGMVPHVQLSTNCRIGCFENLIKYLQLTSSQFLSGLMTARAVNSLPLCIDFPGLTEQTEE